MPPHWVGNVTNSGHVPVELRHWAVLLDLLGKSPLRAERLMRGHITKAMHNRPMGFNI